MPARTHATGIIVMLVLSLAGTSAANALDPTPASGSGGLPTPVGTVEATAAPSPLAAPSGSPMTGSAPFVFYTVFDEALWGGSTWVARADGTDAHQLLDDRGLGGLSPDGHLFMQDVDGGVVLYDVVGPEPRLMNRRFIPCGCGSGTFSPDGTRLAVVSAEPFTAPVGSDQDYGRSVIGILDLATGSVAELESTAVDWPDGVNLGPTWSPDGHRLAFGRREIRPRRPEASGVRERRALYVVDVDGSDLRAIVPWRLSPSGARWSPDGSQIAFTSLIEWRGLDRKGRRQVHRMGRDVYSVHPDGTGVRRLTEDIARGRIQRQTPNLGATFMSWTRDGRIVFTRHRWGGSIELWIMDADAANQQRLDAGSLASLTAAGCVACPYPAPYPRIHPPFLAFWQPTVADEP